MSSDNDAVILADVDPVAAKTFDELVLVDARDISLDGDDVSTLPGEKEQRGITEPFDTREIRIEPKNGQLNSLISRLEYGEIVLDPDFQRNMGIWSDQNQSRLIESLMLCIPIPAFYFDGTDRDKWLVVDGLQRLTAINRFMREKTLRLTGLEFLTEYEGKGFEDLPRSLQRSMGEADLVWYLIMPGTPKNVKFTVFRRINTGGLPLSSQEIRHALNLGPVTKTIKALAEGQAFLEATSYGVAPKRMDDRECVTRFLVFSTFPPESYDKDDFDAFLNTGMDYLNKNPDLIPPLEERFVRTMNAAAAIFGNDAFRKRYCRTDGRFPINKALFESWSVNLGCRTEAELALLQQRKDSLVEGFMNLMLTDTTFEKAVTQGTGAIARVKYRFSKIHGLIQDVLSHA